MFQVSKFVALLQRSKCVLIKGKGSLPAWSQAAPTVAAPGFGGPAWCWLGKSFCVNFLQWHGCLKGFSSSYSIRTPGYLIFFGHFWIIFSVGQILWCSRPCHCTNVHASPMEVNVKLAQADKKGRSTSAYPVAIWTNFRWGCPSPAFQASHDMMVSQSGELHWSKAIFLLARSAPWGTGAEGGEAAALAAAKGGPLAVINCSQNIYSQYFLHLRPQNASVKCWSASFYGPRKETKKGIQG